MVSHVGEHYQVLADGEEGVDAGLAVLVVAVVEVQRESDTRQVNAQHNLLEREAEHFLLRLLGPPEAVENDVGLEDVGRGGRDEAAEADLVQEELVLGGGEREQQEEQVLQDVGEERGADEAGEAASEAGLKVVRVHLGEEQPRRGVERQTHLPDEALRPETDRGRDGGRKVPHVAVGEGRATEVERVRVAQTEEEGEERKGHGQQRETAEGEGEEHRGGAGGRRRKATEEENGGEEKKKSKISDVMVHGHTGLVKIRFLGFLVH